MDLRLRPSSSDEGTSPLVLLVVESDSFRTSRSIAEVRHHLLEASVLFSIRGLGASAKWAAEQAAGLVKLGSDGGEEGIFRSPGIPAEDGLILTLGKAYFEQREYRRAADVTKPGATLVALGLHSYSLYMAGEQRKEETMLETSDITTQNAELQSLKELLSLREEQSGLDGVCYFIYAMVLADLGLREQALDVALRSVSADPWNWCAWELLSRLCINGMSAGGCEAVLSLELPNHFMRDFFYAHAMLELAQKRHNAEALRIYTALRSVFPNSCYVWSRTAVAHYKLNEYSEAEEQFESLRRLHPHRLDDMDVYSNILFVNEEKVQLSWLAHNAVQIDKYRPETCCIIGNYYSAIDEHEKAILYYGRALRLDQHYDSARVLIGLEYIELKNPSAALKTFRRAVEINPREWRAWYGLGQTNELLKMNLKALYYYGKAAELRPHDARMWCAQGKCYKNLKRVDDAIECYQRAEQCKDSEGIALKNLAHLYAVIGEEDKAAQYHHMVLLEVNTQAPESISFLARYSLRLGRYEDAEKFASQLLDFAAKEKEQGKALLRDITSRSEL